MRKMEMPKDEKKRCLWARDDVMVRYHDEEWGCPVQSDEALYEMFLLEAFQAGLSWSVILNKREGFRRAFDGFDVHQIANYGENKINELVLDASIVRCRRKIEAAIENARCFLAIQAEFGSFKSYLDRFTGGKIIVNNACEPITTSALSDQMALDLKKRGMRYMGSITLYSFLQAVGVVNDHEQGCFLFKESKEYE